jgi:hypothetical protein
MKQRVLHSVLLPAWFSFQWICLGGVVAAWLREQWGVAAFMGSFSILQIFLGLQWRKRLLTNPLPKRWTWPYLRWFLGILILLYALVMLPGILTVGNLLLLLLPGGAIVIVLIGLLLSFAMTRGQDVT